MALFKYVDGIRMEVPSSEETVILKDWAKGQGRAAVQETYRLWQSSLPNQEDIHRCMARLVGALAAGTVPDAQDVTDIASYNSLLAQEPSKPGES